RNGSRGAAAVSSGAAVLPATQRVAVEAHVVGDVRDPVFAVVVAGPGIPLVVDALLEQRLVEQEGAWVPGIVLADVDPDLEGGQAGRRSCQGDGTALRDLLVLAEKMDQRVVFTQGGTIGAHDAESLGVGERLHQAAAGAHREPADRAPVGTALGA